MIRSLALYSGIWTRQRLAGWFYLSNISQKLITSEEINLLNNARRPHMPPLEMVQLDDTSYNTKPGGTSPERKLGKMVPTEASKQTSSGDTSLAHQTFEYLHVSSHHRAHLPMDHS
ncbi:hypothetical protein GGI35DRAFT_456722 [Trichoderma velutinum]